MTAPMNSMSMTEKKPGMNPSGVACSVSSQSRMCWMRAACRRMYSTSSARAPLDATPAGPHPFPPRGSYTFTQHHPFVAELAAFDNDKRSVYLLQQRFRRNPYLELFDGPDPNNTTPARSQDSSALQSLYFFNNEWVHKQADAIAVRVAMAETLTPRRIQRAYQLLFQRPAAPAEVLDASKFLTAYTASLKDASVPEDQKPRLALAGLMRTLVSTNEFFFID